jgi:hypothetical protein
MASSTLSLLPGNAPLFDVTSWRFSREDEFEAYLDRSDFFITLVLAADIGYFRDIFIFQVRDFVRLIRQAIPSKDQRKVYISRSRHNPNRWNLWRLPRFTEITPDSAIDVTNYRRNFSGLNSNHEGLARFGGPTGVSPLCLAARTK